MSKSQSILLKIWFYLYRILIFFPILFRVTWYGILHPHVLFNFAFGIVTEIAEFHKRCVGWLKNFNTTPQYQEIRRAFLFSRSNCLNIGFGNIRPMEAQVLGTLVEHFQPKSIFEIGTYNGFSALHLAKNSPPQAMIYTLDLPYDRTDLHFKHDPRDAHHDIKNINMGSARCFHSDPARSKIKELFGDSTTFDYSPYFRKMDFIFIDANHSYSFVKSDTENAFRMLAPGGVILWHDYDFIHPGVFKYLNEIAREKNVYYIERTRYALYIDPSGTSSKKSSQ